jgi:hypothetical protein
MKYYLLLWITGCVGLGCPIPDYEEEVFATQEECAQTLEVAMKVASLTRKSYAGICLPEDAMNRIKAEWPTNHLWEREQ